MNIERETSGVYEYSAAQMVDAIGTGAVERARAAVSRGEDRVMESMEQMMARHEAMERTLEAT